MHVHSTIAIASRCVLMIGGYLVAHSLKCRSDCWWLSRS